MTHKQLPLSVYLFKVIIAVVISMPAWAHQDHPKAQVEQQGIQPLKQLRASGFVVCGRSNTKMDTRHWLILKKNDELYACDRQTATGGSNGCRKVRMRSDTNPISLLKQGYRFTGQTTELRQKPGCYKETSKVFCHYGGSTVRLHFESSSQYIYCPINMAQAAQSACVKKPL